MTQIYYCITEYRLDYSNMNTVLLFCVLHCCSTYCMGKTVKMIGSLSKFCKHSSIGSHRLSYCLHALLCSFACRGARSLNSLTSHSSPYSLFHCDVLFTQGRYFALLVLSENIDTWYNILRTLLILSHLHPLSCTQSMSELSHGLKKKPLVPLHV